MAHNLEKHPTRAGTYIAYDAAGFAFRVAGASAGGWSAMPSHSGAAGDTRRFFGDRLRDVAAQIGASRQDDVA